jgi:hypothetical protein
MLDFRQRTFGIDTMFAAMANDDDGNVERFHIAESDEATARATLIRTLPRLSDATVTMQELPEAYMTWLHLEPGRVQRWTLGEILHPRTLLDPFASR